MIKSLATLALLSLTALGVVAAEPVVAFSSRIDYLKQRATTDTAIGKELEPMLKQADLITQRAILRRVDTLEDFAKLDDKWGRKMEPHKRTEMMKDKVNARFFGLASADTSYARTLLVELPLLAAAYRLTGKPAYRDYLQRQLEEMSGWNPLQRPGWTLNVRSKRLRADGDGVWLATGCNIQALVITLSLLPPDALTPELRQKLDVLLERELKLILKDWHDQRPWYVKQQKIQSNQWIVPASGLALAAIRLGRDRYPEAYKLAKDSLRRSLDCLGDEGAVSEGIGYALDWTIPALALTAHYMAVAGDPDFINHPFMKKFPFWLTQSYQPGQNVINAFDWWGGCRNMYLGFRPKITMLTALTADPGLQWILFHQHRSPSDDVFGMITLGLPPDNMKEPALFAFFKRAARVNWRSGWDDQADGIWIRGWHREDFHAHDDAGHISYIKNGKIVLLEAGTGGYSDPLKSKEYDSVRGHNVLQVGETQRTKKEIDAPFTIKRLDAAGGEIEVEAAAAYPGVASWLRQVAWDTRQVKVVDQVKMQDGKADKLLFRWHLGSEKPAVIKNEGNRWQLEVPAGKIEFPGWIGDWNHEALPKPEKDIVETPAITIVITADRPISVTQAPYIDHTMKFRARYHKHTTIEVQSAGPTASLRCETVFTAK